MWKVVNYEVCGRGHQKMAMPCQDRTLYKEVNGVSIIGLADGAGSAKLSHFGAETVLQTASAYIGSNFDVLINNPDGKQVKASILNNLLESLKQLSEDLECTMKDLASTFLMVAIKGETFLICHIGDGVIGYLKEAELKIASKPQNGEFANVTTFVNSKEALLMMKLFKGSTKDMSGFVLMSDGTAESFYNKKEDTLAPVLIKMMHRNALIERQRIIEGIKHSFDTVVMNNTQDDCSIAIISRISPNLCSYSEMDKTQKCDLLGIKFRVRTCTKQLCKYDAIIDFLDTPKNLEQIARFLQLRRKYVKRHMRHLLNVGIITYAKQGFKYIN